MIVMLMSSRGFWAPGISLELSTISPEPSTVTSFPRSVYTASAPRDQRLRRASKFPMIPKSSDLTRSLALASKSASRSARPTVPSIPEPQRKGVKENSHSSGVDEADWALAIPELVRNRTMANCQHLFMYSPHCRISYSLFSANESYHLALTCFAGGERRSLPEPSRTVHPLDGPRTLRSRIDNWRETGRTTKALRTVS